MELGIVFSFLLLVSLFDLWYYRVPNEIFIIIMFFSLFRRCQQYGAFGLAHWLLGMIIPFLICYLFFCCRMIGAADCKLFSVIGSYVGCYNGLRIMMYALFAAALMALVKMFICRNFRRRFRHLFQYVSKVYHSRKLHKYCSFKELEHEAVVPFTVGIAIATLYVMF